MAPQKGGVFTDPAVHRRRLDGQTVDEGLYIVFPALWLAKLGERRITNQVIDSTGFKVFGEGEWKVRKHGAEKRRVWYKLRLAVDPATHDIVVAEVSLENVHAADLTQSSTA